MTIEQYPFGILPDGREVQKFILRNNNGMEVCLINYGAIITALKVPGRHHEPGDVVLGFDTLEGYLSDHPYFGAIIGRVCNRTGGASFEIGGHLYRLSANEGKNQLHGGHKGFDKVLWTPDTVKSPDEVSVTFSYLSPDGEEGYPGNLQAVVVYTLNDANELAISMQAQTDRPTHVNLTNHSYFNLDDSERPVYDHLLMIDADGYTVLDAENIATGEIRKVDGTPYDFREAKPVGQDIRRLDMGYDINYVLNKKGPELEKAAVLHDPRSGRTLEVLTTQPGVQLYTSNYVSGIKGKDGKVYNKHSAVCLETQHFPNTPNQASFPSTLLNPGEKYNELIVYRFSAG
ncbi:MAG: galactose mutarotase [Bacteroidales bacterium]|nr:galactose mutarotase [Bacteroidales bacterium]